MKKVLAIVLALVMALSWSAMAFATDDAATATTAATTEVATTEIPVAEFSIKEVLAMIVELAKAGMAQWNDVESVVIKIVDFVDGLVDGIFAAGGVDGLIAELEGLFEGVEIPGIDELINALKEKILSFYAPGIVPTTEAEAPVDTGSAPVGIAVFAAVSVAAAAAFVCTKKD